MDSLLCHSSKIISGFLNLLNTVFKFFFSNKDLGLSFIAIGFLTYFGYFLLCCTRYYSNDYRESRHYVNAQPGVESTTQINVQLAQNQPLIKRGRPSGQRI